MKETTKINLRNHAVNDQNKQDNAVSSSASVMGLGADADYAYKDIEEFEAIVGYKVNNVFRDGWRMARTTNLTKDS